jgi:hypothetical protein
MPSGVCQVSPGEVAAGAGLPLSKLTFVKSGIRLMRLPNFGVRGALTGESNEIAPAAP